LSLKNFATKSFQRQLLRKPKGREKSFSWFKITKISPNSKVFGPKKNKQFNFLLYALAFGRSHNPKARDKTPEKSTKKTQNTQTNLSEKLIKDERQKRR
jgi:hypothetical protein